MDGKCWHCGSAEHDTAEHPGRYRGENGTPSSAVHAVSDVAPDVRSSELSRLMKQARDFPNTATVDLLCDEIRRVILRSNAEHALAARLALEAEVAGLRAELAERQAVNLNDSVWVKLTETGRETLLKYYSPFNLTRAAQEKTADVCNAGWRSRPVRFQLWALLAIFGASVHLGMVEVPFEGSRIEFGEGAPQPSTAQPPDGGGASNPSVPGLGKHPMCVGDHEGPCNPCCNPYDY